MRAEFFAKIIGPRTQNLVKALGTDVVPIDPPIPVCSTQGVVFRVDANMLTDKQLVSLTNLLSREQSLTIQEVENSLATLGLGIPVEDCVLPKIAQRQIDLLRDLFRQNVAEAYHGTNKEDTVSEVLWVSIMIIMLILGDEWYKRNIRDTLFTDDKRILFLRPKLETEQQRYEHQSRTIMLAESLFVLQSCEGFDIKMEDLRKVSPKNPHVRLEDLAVELQIASMITRRGHIVKFRTPSGTKRKDFDIEIAFRKKTKIYSEIKCKRDDTEVNVNNLRRTLYTAEKQLPIDNPSLIFMRIPPDWIHYESLAPELNRTISNFFRNVNHVNAIVLVWDELKTLRDNRTMTVGKFRFTVHPSPKYPVQKLDELIPPVQIPSATKGTYIELAFGKFFDDQI